MILAIDIGIRNLSFCCANCLDKTDFKTYDIQLWDVYNTLDSDDYKCTSTMKNGNICNKKCSFKYNDIYCCKTHFPKDIKVTKHNEFKKKKVDDYLLQDIAKIVLEKIQCIYDLNIDIFTNINQIVIELQPKINQKMKFISHIVYGKFVELYKYTNTTIKFVRASIKLKAYTGPLIECKLKGKYAQRKWLSIKYGEWFLENKFSQEQRDKWLQIFQSKNKADMGDTFLMVINALHGLPKTQITNKKDKCIK